MNAWIEPENMPGDTDCAELAQPATQEQMRAFEEAAAPLPWTYWATVATVALSILSAIGVLLGPWGFAQGPQP